MEDPFAPVQKDRLSVRSWFYRQGFAVVPMPVLRSKTLSSSAKVVYSVLCRYAAMPDGIFPGHETLARETGLGERTIRAALVELRDDEGHWVSWVQRGLTMTNLYTFNELPGFPGPAESAGQERQTSAGQDRLPDDTKEQENHESESGEDSCPVGKPDIPVVAPVQLSPEADPVPVLFAAIKVAWGKNGRYGLTAARRKKLESRLEDFSSDALLLAARSAAADHYMVQNGYLRIETVFRNEEKVERWLTKAEQSGMVAKGGEKDWGSWRFEKETEVVNA